MVEALVRPATLQDVPSIARVHVDAWRETYQGVLPSEFLQSLSYESREEQWRRALSNPSSRVHLHVMQEKGGSVGGFVAVGPERGEMEDYDGELYAIYLLKQYQGLGYGRKLFAGGARALVNEGFRSLVLWVLEDNLTRGFYKHLGGSVVGQKMIEVGGGEYAAVAYGWVKLPGANDK